MIPPKDAPVYMHYVARDPGGPIKQVHREVSQAVGTRSVSVTICSGSDMRVPCQPGRKYFSRGVGRGKSFRLTELFMVTAQLYAERTDSGGKPVRLELVTCPRCKASALYKRDAEAYGR